MRKRTSGEALDQRGKGCANQGERENNGEIKLGYLLKGACRVGLIPPRNLPGP